MLISLKWLKNYVSIPSDLKTLTSRLDLTGTVVDGVKTTGDSLDGVVVGHILTREPHSNADSLWVTTVDVGADEPLQIVCGAQNFVAGDKVPVATIGTTMPNGMKIKKSKLRGIESYGMNCSSRELGVGASHDGLLILPEDAPVGMPIAEYLGVSDTVLDLEITPNRPDCLSVLGVAREAGAVFKEDVSFEFITPEESNEDAANFVTVDIEDNARCPRYVARVIKDVKIGPSPDWLVERLSACGARSINNIVDITNYVLFLLGQPLHAFDLNKLRKDEQGRATIVVRPAKDNEKFTTLDEVERTLSSDVTVITDGTDTVALAGVMGGLDSEVTNETTDILLECATFSGGHTSRTSRRLSLVSESSMRYERGVDEATLIRNIDYAAALMAELAGGTVCKGVVDCYPAPKTIEELDFRVARFCSFIGAEVTAQEAADILTRLGCEVSANGDDLKVVPPTFRPDLTREIDLYEEVLRLWGMERVEGTIPPGVIGGLTKKQAIKRKVGATLRALGLNETMTYSFADPSDLTKLNMSEEGRGDAVELLNPMSSEQSVMRRSILPGLLASVAYNQSHGTKNIHLYEIGSVFFGRADKKQPKEKQMLCGVLAGAWHEDAWNVKAVPFDFFDGKGVLEGLFGALFTKPAEYQPVDYAWMQPGRVAKILIDKREVGYVGEVHPTSLSNFDVVAPVVAFEIDMDALYAVTNEALPYRDVPRFPAVEYDMALVVDDDVSALSILRAIKGAHISLLESARLFDVYKDEKRLGAGKKSLAFKLTYRALDKTLTAEEVDNAHAKLLKKVSGATGAELRG